MALPIIKSDSFVGKKFLNDVEQLEAVAVDVVDEWIIKVLSEAAYIDIKASTKTKWTDLFNGVNWIDSDNKQRKQRGFTDFLECITYFEFVRNYAMHTPSGFVRKIGQNSEIASTSFIYQLASQSYNKGVCFLQNEIYRFIDFYKSITVNITGFTDNGGGNYNIEIENRKYLDNGDSVTINGISYIISNLSETAPFSFDITAETGISFSGSFTYKPYDDFNLPILDVIV